MPTIANRAEGRPSQDNIGSLSVNALTVANQRRLRAAFATDAPATALFSRAQVWAAADTKWAKYVGLCLHLVRRPAP